MVVESKSMRKLKKDLVSRSIVQPLRFDGHPLRSDIFEIIKLENGSQLYDIDENQLFRKLENLLMLLDSHF